MLNPFKDVNWNPGRAERRKFALSLIIGFPVIAALFTALALLKTHAAKPFFVWLGAVGCLIGFVFWLLPQIARPFYVVWYALGCSIGIIIGNIMFAAFYFLVVTPLGLALRLLGRDPLRKTFNRVTPTYWQEAKKGIDPKRYYRQF